MHRDAPQRAALPGRWLDKHAVLQRNKVRQVQDLGRQAKQLRDAMFNDPEYKNMLEAEAQALQRESSPTTARSGGSVGSGRFGSRSTRMSCCA